MDEIRNRVEESGLIQLELSKLETVECIELDFTSWLRGGLIVVEKEFRLKLSEIDASHYTGKGVGLKVVDGAIIPDWAWMVICAKLETAAFVVLGGKPGAITESIRLAIDTLDVETFRDKRVIVKGCDEAGGPEELLKLQRKLKPVVKTLMFGEACSTVPVFKRK
jgi:hypothetical protein